MIKKVELSLSSGEAATLLEIIGKAGKKEKDAELNATREAVRYERGYRAELLRYVYERIERAFNPTDEEPKGDRD